MKVFWLSKHMLTKEQENILLQLHPGAEIYQENVILEEIYSLARYIQGKEEGSMVYCVAPVEQMLTAQADGLVFGFFTMKPKQGRSSGFVVDKVYQVLSTSSDYANPGGPYIVWTSE